jgi:hypothetical protein
MTMRRFAGALLFCLSLSLPVATFAAEHRYYDRDGRDYHEWNDGERRAYRHWVTEERHEHYRDYNRLRAAQQRDYWRWRHEHMDWH